MSVQDLPTPTYGGGYATERERMGFFTDTSVCIGCKACEVACKEWNLLPTEALGFSGRSYDNTLALGSDTWRHVAFVEQERRIPMPAFDLAGSAAAASEGAAGASVAGGLLDLGDAGQDGGVRWLMSSDVCKHCTSAACMEVCPTGALFRTEVGSVVVQPDICNGCGYCVPACPFGVIDRREDDGRAWKCTLCYDRTKDGLEPACAKACPTDSIQYGPVSELRQRAGERLTTLKAQGEHDANLYLADADNGIHGAGAFFLLLDEPEVYGLPPDPVSPTRDVASMWRFAALAAGAVLAGAAAAVAGGRR